MIYGQNAVKKKNADAFYIKTISVIFILIISLIMMINKTSVWGSETDWLSQHFSLPEYFRTRFYATGELFPDFAPQLGGGQDIYNFAYYGLLNPVYLPAYLMSWVRMADYIQVVSLLCILISCIMCYFFMKRHFSSRISFFLTIMFMCSAPVIFQSHRHIMFVNYFPFLFLALYAVGLPDGVKSRLLLIVSSYCILCSSFYFSISSFAVIIIYAVFIQLNKNENIKLKQLMRYLSGRIAAIALGGIIAGVLWLPTFYTLMCGREKGSSYINILKLFIPTVNLQFLLYSSYSIGSTIIAVAAVIAMVKSGRKSVKFLSCVFILLVCFPLIIYLCNGTMYIDSKVLIPFLPLLLIICGEFYLNLFTDKMKIRRLIIVLSAVVIIDIIFNYRKLSLNIILIADTVIFIFAVLAFKKVRKREFILIPVAVMAFINCIIVNLSESYVSRDELNKVYSEEVQQLVDKTTASDSEFYRFANDADKGLTVNRIYGSDYYSPNVYSSVSNSDYRDFRFESSASENSCRNNAVHAQPKNEIFNILMGCRYRISQNGTAVFGEKTEDECNGYYLFKNENALPVGYSSANTMSEECFENLDAVSKTEALIENIIVPHDAGVPVIPSGTKKLDCNFEFTGDTSCMKSVNDAYEINSDKPFLVTVKLNEPVTEKLILLQLHADNRIGKKSERSDVWVTVNGVKNKLSDPGWKYNNKNYDFSYVLSPDENIDELVFEFSEGNYIVSLLFSHSGLT